MVAKKMTILMLALALLLPAAALAAGAAANVRANTPPPPNGPENNYMQSPEWVFFSACTAGDMGALTALVQKNGDLIRLRLPDGKTGLHLAVMALQRDAVEYLLNHGADVNARDMYDKTPLYYATNHCHDARISALLRSRGGVIRPSKLYYGDGQYTLYRNHTYLECPTCYWESVGGYPEGSTLPGARPPADVPMAPSSDSGRPAPGAMTPPPPMPAPGAAPAPAEPEPAPAAPAATTKPGKPAAAPAEPAPAAAPAAPAPKPAAAPAPKPGPKGKPAAAPTTETEE